MESDALDKVAVLTPSWDAQSEWRNNVRLVKCNEDVVVPCPRCKHHFGEHDFDGGCHACAREVARSLGPSRAENLLRINRMCGVNMHDAWPDLVPTTLHAV